MPRTITKVGYVLDTKDAIKDAESRRIFTIARNDSTILESLKKAVLDSANDMHDMPGGAMPCPPKGARWKNPNTGDRYNVHWNYSGSDTVIVDWLSDA